MTAVVDRPVTEVPPASRGSVKRLLLGEAGDPRWVRPLLWATLLLAALLHTWGLSANGDANTYYAAAVLSGSQSWKAWFFGALDAGSFITVDKPPFALWVMGLSARLFGYGTWSMLLPQALAGVAAVGILYATVRRCLVDRLGKAGAAAAATLAALVLALSPITVAINRDNNPDTLLVLLLVAAAWYCLRAVQNGRLLPLLASAFLVGCAFNTKMLQAYLVVPAFAVVYLLCADTTLLRRIRDLVLAGVMLVVSSGWWMGVVALIPAGSRPYIGGSTDNTVWDLVIGYNGLGRIFGNSGPGGGMRGGGGFGGESGAGRMFNDIVGGQISWLLPAAALLALVGLLVIGRARRADPARALLLLWGGWLAVHFVVFSFAQGTFHPYYTTAMAPAIGALVGAGAVLAWRAGKAWAWVLPVTVAVTGWWAFTVLRRTPDWHPWVAWTVAAATVLAVLLLLVAGYRASAGRALGVAALTAALVAGLAGPAAYSVSAAGSQVNGTNPLAGPSTGMGGPGGMGRPSGGFPGGGFPGGEFPGGTRSDSDGQTMQQMPQGDLPDSGNGSGNGGMGGGGMGRGGLSDEMISYLVEHQGSALWLVAVNDAQSAASTILRTGEPVISMGGFTGSDNAMSVEKLKELVEAGELKYIVLGGSRGGGDGDLTSWVQENGTAVDLGDGTSSSTLYELG